MLCVVPMLARFAIKGGCSFFNMVELPAEYVVGVFGIDKNKISIPQHRRFLINTTPQMSSLSLLLPFLCSSLSKASTRRRIVC